MKPAQSLSPLLFQRHRKPASRRKVKAYASQHGSLCPTEILDCLVLPSSWKNVKLSSLIKTGFYRKHRTRCQNAGPRFARRKDGKLLIEIHKIFVTSPPAFRRHSLGCTRTYRPAPCHTYRPPHSAPSSAARPYSATRPREGINGHLQLQHGATPHPDSFTLSVPEGRGGTEVLTESTKAAPALQPAIPRRVQNAAPLRRGHEAHSAGLRGPGGGTNGKQGIGRRGCLCAGIGWQGPERRGAARTAARAAAVGSRRSQRCRPHGRACTECPAHPGGSASL